MVSDYQCDFAVEPSEPRQSTTQVLLVETINYKKFTKFGPPKAKSNEEFMIEHILKKSMFTCTLPSNATEEEKQAERAKVLNHKRTRWRFISFIWPRDPNGKRLTDANSRLGKMAGGGRELIWGATLADLYYVYRDPNIDCLLTIVSGSKMYNWCKAEGEDYILAKDVMQRAADEEHPHVVPVYSLQDLIRSHEYSVGAVFAVSWTGENEERENERTAEELPEPWPPKSPFHAYPKPWPFSPFTRDWLFDGIRVINHLPTLQEYIPQHLLPEKLVVHDPWKLLYAVDSKKDKHTPWEEKQDITHIYKLKPSSKNTTRHKTDRKEYDERAAKSKTVRKAFLANPHSSQELPDGMVYIPGTGGEMLDIQIGPSKPPVFIVFPSRQAPTPSKKAHLFLSPAETIGQGHHSFVYRAEFEIPRSLVVVEDICTMCVCKDAERILLEKDGPNGERRDPKWDELSGKYFLRETGKPGVRTMFGGEQYELRPDTLHWEAVYEGPYRAIETTIGYQNIERAPYCEHLPNPRIHPLTAKTLVAAKLSIQHDRHLEREAENYQSFPKNFFEHYNGFNMVKPLVHPTPVGALVPQFYGYYVLDESDKRNQRGKDRYLSPILLIEECGKAIVPEELTLDDQEECASLVYRLHLAGWVHNSLYRRNIVQQPGPLSAEPDLRLWNACQERGGLGKDWSFRMIDFGRTTHQSQTSKSEWEEHRAYEDSTVHDWILGEKMLEP